MTVKAEKEVLGFQTEVKQLLHLMIHSLYSNPEIFLRELISNSSDAADKLRFAALAKPELLQNDPDLKIHIDIDKQQNTITISDNGIGMSREEVISQLGTIAKSGTREFLQTLSGDQAKDAKLIGQFGVGFYSSFIVADEVTVLTRRADLNSDQAVIWKSKGEGDYTIENAEKANRGTIVTLHIRKEQQEYLDSWRLRNIITKYSDHIALPILMKKQPIPGADEKEEDVNEYETVNRAKALWTVDKKEISDEEYHEFYKHISHDYDDPAAWSHYKVEGNLQYTALLFIPKHAPFDLWHRDHTRGLKLYVQRVFIMDDAEQFLPQYLRFIKGIIDTNDLPLNISREILQSSKTVDSLKKGCVNKILSLFESMAKDEPEKYADFWKVFGQVLKEGPAEDFSNKDRLAKLLMFSSTLNDSETQNVTFDAYIERMKQGQDKIYYVTAESFAAAKNSPHLEIFRKKGVEVILLYDRVDEWLVSNLTEYAGKKLVSVAKGDLDLGDLEDEKAKEEHKKAETEYTDVVSRVKNILKDRVEDVRVTHRLTDSPTCIVAPEYGMSGQLQRILEQAGQQVPDSKPVFEINPEHPMITKLKNEVDEDRFAEWTKILFDQAILAEGGKLPDPAQFVKRLNKMLLAVV